MEFDIPHLLRWCPSRSLFRAGRLFVFRKNKIKNMTRNEIPLLGSRGLVTANVSKKKKYNTAEKIQNHMFVSNSFKNEYFPPIRYRPIEINLQ